MINNEIYGNIKKLVKGKKLNSRKPIEIDAYFEKCPFCNNIILKNPVKEKSCPICFNEIFDEESYEFSMTLPDNRKLSSIRVFGVSGVPYA